MKSALLIIICKLISLTIGFQTEFEVFDNIPYNYILSRLNTFPTTESKFHVPRNSSFTVNWFGDEDYEANDSANADNRGSTSRINSDSGERTDSLEYPVRSEDGNRARAELSMDYVETSDSTSSNSIRRERIESDSRGTPGSNNRAQQSNITKLQQLNKDMRLQKPLARKLVNSIVRPAQGSTVTYAEGSTVRSFKGRGLVHRSTVMSFKGRGLLHRSTGMSFKGRGLMRRGRRGVGNRAVTGVRQGKGSIIRQKESSSLHGQGSTVRLHNGSGVSHGKGSVLIRGERSGPISGDDDMGYKERKDGSHGEGSVLIRGERSGARPGEGGGMGYEERKSVRNGEGSGIGSGAGSGVRDGVGCGVTNGEGNCVTHSEGSVISCGEESGETHGERSGVRHGEGIGTDSGRGSMRMHVEADGVRDVTLARLNLVECLIRAHLLRHIGHANSSSWQGGDEERGMRETLRRMWYITAVRQSGSNAVYHDIPAEFSETAFTEWEMSREADWQSFMDAHGVGE